MATIVVGTDGSKGSEAALSEGFESSETPLHTALRTLRSARGVKAARTCSTP
jgi:DNA-binding GntR family transcriptional regulator